MSASDGALLAATAMRVAGNLARYERHVRRLVASWLDMDLYLNVSQEIDEIRHDCVQVPQLSLPWTALLISHADLVHALWRSGEAHRGGPTEEVALQLQEHLAGIDRLARQCLRVAAATERSTGAAD